MIPARLPGWTCRFGIGAGRRCYLAIDLSSTTDLTALVAAIDDGAGGFELFAWLFMPREMLMKRQEEDDTPYKEWVRQGWITATEGAVVDYEAMHGLVFELAEHFEVRRVPIDRWNSTGTVTALQAKDLPVMLHGQGLKDMAPSVNATERAIIGGRVRQDGNPVLWWCVANAGAKSDEHDNKKLVKIEQRRRIDGAVCTVMAIGAAAGDAGDDRPSIYASPEVEALVTEEGAMTDEELAQWGL